MVFVLLACGTGEVPEVDAAQPDEVTQVDCKTTCSLGDQQEHIHLSDEEIEVLLQDWALQPIGEPTIELETLLFYFHDTEDWLADNVAPVDYAHLAFIERELARDHVTVEMRLLDEDGEVRGTLPPTDIPLKEKQHIVFDGTGSLGHLETGGKVKRVGLDHLWSRW
ncbi:MAG TPA: hypothetical protein QGF58_19110 [Myxococcota bacterium]|nr:hypothetical protein [Myxococcota bacterium]